MKYIKNYVLVLLGLIAFDGQAQDIHFTQFFNSPLTLNPAQTGDFTGDWRLSNNYRRQWGSVAAPFITFTVGLDKSIPIAGQKMSGGILVLHDKSGNPGLELTKFYGSLAYQHTLKSQQFSFGIQGGYVRKVLNTNGLKFPDQFDVNSGGFNSAAATTATIGMETQSDYFDFNAGFQWSGDFHRFRPKLGYSIFHLNLPEDSFYGYDSQLNMRNVMHGEAEIDLNDRLFLWPMVIYQELRQGSQLLAGSMLGITVADGKDNLKDIYLGPLVRSGFGRNTDAISAIFGLRFTHLNVGVSYDFNVSSLISASRSLGGFELTLQYAPNLKVKQITIPCDRY